MSVRARKREAPAAVDVILRDGSTLRLEEPSSDDLDALEAFFSGLSDRSFYLRFHGVRTVDRALVEHFADPDWRDRGVLVGVLADEIVAVAEFMRLRDERSAEVAFAVADEHQGRGIGTRLLEQLAMRASAAGIERFVAQVLPENSAMLAVFRDAGFDTARELDRGAIEVAFPIAATETFRARVDERDHRAVTASLRPFFEPRSLAVVGASHRRGSIGGELFRNVLAADFEGAAYPVNRDGGPVGGVRGFRSLAEVPEVVDLVVICLPGEHVLGAAEEALALGIKALCVISSGFAEIGAEGAERQARLLELIRAHGGRLVGPNCLGIAIPPLGLNATFGPRPLPPGPIAFSSQSGALGLALLEKASERRLGLLRVRLDREQGRRLLERPARVVGGRSRQRGRPALPRVVRQPGQVQPARAARGAAQAHSRAQGGDDRRRREGCELAHGRSRELGRRGRRALPPGGRAPRAHPRGARRCRRAPLAPAAPAWEPRRRRDERGRARDPLRRRLRVGRPRPPRANRGDAGRAGRAAPGRGERREPRGHARRVDGRDLREGDPAAPCGQAARCADRALRPACRRGRGRGGGRDQRRRQPRRARASPCSPS